MSKIETIKTEINNCGCGGETRISSSFGVQAHMVFCENCGLRTEDCDSVKEAIESWNTAHPKISNAVQAVKWLEAGEKIEEVSKNNYYAGEHFYEKDNEGRIICVDVENESYDSTDNFFSEILFTTEWKIYEEHPKYKEVGYKEAVIGFFLKNKVTAEIGGKEHRLKEIHHGYIIFEGVKVKISSESAIQMAYRRYDA